MASSPNGVPRSPPRLRRLPPIRRRLDLPLPHHRTRRRDPPKPERRLRQPSRPAAPAVETHHSESGFSTPTGGLCCGLRGFRLATVFALTSLTAVRLTSARVRCFPAVDARPHPG